MIVPTACSYRQVQTPYQVFSEKERPTPLLRNGAPESNSPKGGMETVDDGRLPRGRISTPKKAKQVSWLAARLTLCAFPSRIARNSGLCRFQRRSQLRGSNGLFPTPSSDDVKNHRFPLEVPQLGTTQLRVFSCWSRFSPPQAERSYHGLISAICIRTTGGSQGISSGSDLFAQRQD